MLWSLASLFFLWLVVRELRSPFDPLHPEPIYLPYLLVVSGLAVACAWPPFRIWRLELRLAQVASVLADGRRASVHCNTMFDTLLDPNMLAAGHANPQTGSIVLQKPWCSRLQAYLADPEHASDVERYSLQLFTHEVMHVRGELNEARTECQAMQRSVHAARLLGVPTEIALRDARADYRMRYPRLNQPGTLSAPYYSPLCASGAAWDEHLPDPPWP